MRPLLIYISLLIGLKAMTQNCQNLKEGKYEYESNRIKVKVEFTDKWQLETNEKYGLIFLNKLYKIEDCKYQIDTYKVLRNDIGMTPDLNSSAIMTITNVIGNEYHYEFRVKDSDEIYSGVYSFVSEGLSEEFNNIIKKESNKE